MKRILYIMLLLTMSFGQALAVDYNASAFGCVSDGQTNNTRSIQAAIDLISSKGGGTLNFYVGRYLTGGLELKSNVTINLHEGAILVANPSYYDFIEKNGKRYFIYGENQSNVKIIGKGVILGQAAAVKIKIDDQVSKGIVSKDINSVRPTLLGLNNCQNVEIDGIMLEDSSGDVAELLNCTNVSFKNQIIRSQNYENSRGLVLAGSKGVSFENLYVDTAGKALVKDKASQTTAIKKSITPNGKSI